MDPSPFTVYEEQSKDGIKYTKRWYELCAQTVQLQGKIEQSLKKLNNGLDWMGKDQEELSALLEERAELAQQFGLLVMLFLQKKIEIPSLLEDHRPEQLSLFAHQAMDGSLHWLRRKAERIAPPKVLETRDELTRALSTLERSLTDLSSWFIHNSEHQQMLFEHVVARLRYIQEECPGDFDRTIRSFFHRITDYSKKHTPGFIHGLSLSHKPKHERWLEDAQESWKKMMTTIQPSPERDALRKIIPLLVEPINIIALENVLVQHKDVWGVANMLRRLSPFISSLQSRPALKELVSSLRIYQEKLSEESS